MRGTPSLQRRHQVSGRGFTLLEVLITMALLSIILGALYSTFSLSHRALDGMDSSLLKLRECRTALDRIARETESAVYSAGNRNSRFKLTDRDVYGRQASGLTLTTLSPLVPGLSLISYSVEEHDGVMTLMKHMQSAYQPQGDTEGSEVIEGIEEFALEAKDGITWVKTWDTAETNKLPSEVRITLTMRIQDSPVTVYEIIRPRIGREL